MGYGLSVNYFHSVMSLQNIFSSSSRFVIYCLDAATFLIKYSGWTYF
jgi:hypothetical protein